MLTQLRKIVLAAGFVMAVAAAPVYSASADEAAAPDDSNQTSSAYTAEFSKAFDKAFDVLILRPLDAAAVVAGAGLMIPASVFGLMGGMEVVEDSWDILVLTNWESLVDRPLGELDS